MPNLLCEEPLLPSSVGQQGYLAQEHIPETSVDKMRGGKAVTGKNRDKFGTVGASSWTLNWPETNGAARAPLNLPSLEPKLQTLPASSATEFGVTPPCWHKPRLERCHKCQWSLSVVAKAPVQRQKESWGIGAVLPLGKTTFDFTQT